MRRLPSLNGVRAFEAAARCGSFAAAGLELNVTPAAVSRLVRLLEQRLDVALFQRHANRLRLTPAGQTYQAGLTQMLDGLAQLTRRVTEKAGTEVLTVGVGPTFAMRWLIPRLAQFGVEAPEIEVRITTGGAARPFSADWTCGIRLGKPPWPGLVAERLFRADMMPVCAPGLASRCRDPAQLDAKRLMRVTHAPDDWATWLKSAGAPQLSPLGPHFDFYDQAQQAAIDGVGIAMGIRPYVDDDLAAGRLVAPFARTVSKGSAWYLLYSKGHAGEPGFEKFRSWLKRSAGRSRRVTSRER